MNPFFNQYPQNQPNMYQQFQNMYNNNMNAQNNPNGMGFNPFIYQQFMNQNYMNMNNNNNMQQLFQMFLQWMNNYNNCNNYYNFNNNQYRNTNANTNTNTNFNANGGNNNVIQGGNQRTKETLPRFLYNTNKIIDYPDEEKENMRNAIFLCSTGIKVPVSVPYYETIENLLRLFVKKVGIGESTLGKDIFFIFDAMYLQIDDKRAIYELCQSNNPIISVIDAGNVIGA